jgi:hypothetical protein
MGMFDWLFGKKNAAGNVATPQAPTAAPVAAHAPPPPSQPRSVVEVLLQRSKELSPNDPDRARTLLAEMLQAEVSLPANADGANELAMALDSMARHYPDCLRELAQSNGPSPVRQRAEQLLAHRRQLAAAAVRSPEENLRRWRESAAPAWVEARQGEWDHQQWTDLLESLQRSEFWPMNVEDVGLTLEQLKVERQARRP